MSLLAPVLFVLIWSTGFIAARAVAPHADPSLFLTLRFLVAAGLFALIARWRGPVLWPSRRQIVWHLMAGMAMTGLYLGLSWWAVAHGLAAGIMALIGALQPLMTALAVAIRSRSLPQRRIAAGLLLGFAGVALVLSPRLDATAGIPLWPALLGLVSIVALTAGTMVQKSALAKTDLFVSVAIQQCGGAMVTAVLVLLAGELRWDHAPALWAAFAWSVAGLSVGGSALLIAMVRQGDVTKTAALLLLVPPAAAIQAWLLFGETLTAIQLGGFGLTLAGVALAQGLVRKA